jgi:hypothetical protein
VNPLRVSMIAAAILICAYAPAKANFYNGNELLSFCTDKNTMEVCYGYIAGLADEENTVSILSKRPDVSFCLPDAASIGQLTDVVIAFWKKNADTRQLPASFLVHLILATHFPCIGN